MLNKLHHTAIILLGIIWLLGAGVTPARACGAGGDGGMEDCRTITTYCYDADNDGAGNPDLLIARCDTDPPELGFVANCSDSNDADANIQ